MFNSGIVNSYAIELIEMVALTVLCNSEHFYNIDILIYRKRFDNFMIKNK